MINIAGAFSHFNELSIIILKYKLKDVYVYDSLGDHQWNGGRVNYLYSAAFDPQKVQSWNRRGVGVFLTLSNRYIDYSLEPVSELTVLNQNPLNGIISGNDEFTQYIKSHYSNLKVMRSVTSFDTLDIPDMKPLEQLYDLICPRFEWVFNPNFYNNIDVTKYEIMLNDTCKYDCKLWAKHFDAINIANRDRVTDKAVLHKTQECWLSSVNPNTGWKTDIEKYGDCLGMDLNATQVQKAREIGYRHWKISGRELAAEYVQEIQHNLGVLL